MPSPHQPLAKGTHRARVARSRRGLLQEVEPSMHVHLTELVDLEYVALDEQILLELAQRRLMPDDGFGPMSGPLVMLQISLNSLLNRQSLTADRDTGILRCLRRRARHLRSLNHLSLALLSRCSRVDSSATILRF